MPHISKVLKDDKKIIKTELYPININKYKCRNSVALIGVGANLGNCIRRFERLFYHLQRSSYVNIIATSIIFKNPPFGYLKQPFFYNTLILIDTKLTPIALLKYLQRVELHFGRKREFKNAPRTLDLDILLYNKRKIKKDTTLIIPHPFWQERESVQLPLKYLKGSKCLKRVL